MKDTRHKYPSYPRVYLTQERLKLGISAEELSRRLDLSKSYYYALENGSRGHNIGVLLLTKITESLDADIKEMIDSEVRYINERDIFLKRKLKYKGWIK